MLKWKGLPEPTKKDKVVKEFENNVLIKPIHVSTREGSSSGLAYIILFFIIGFWYLYN